MKSKNIPTKMANFKILLWHHMDKLGLGPHMKALRLPVSEKNFEDQLLCSYVHTCDTPHPHHPRAGSVLTPGASYESSW